MAAPPPIQAVGNYRVLGELARGAMGVVYRGHDTALDRAVAIKVLLTKTDSAATDLERFRLEARVTARLRHPHIVAIQTAGAIKGKPYLVMDLIEGRSLKEVLKQQGKMRPSVAVAVCEKLARALHYAHGLGILHRDVKPANVLLDERGEPYLTDFGLAKLLGADDTITVSGEVHGTPLFMAPEQAMGNRELVGPRSDVYALGATMYQLLTGEPPYVGQSVVEVLSKVVGEDPTPPTKVYPRLDPRLEEIVLKAMQKEPGERYRDALGLARALSDYLEARGPEGEDSAEGGDSAAATQRRSAFRRSGLKGTAGAGQAPGGSGARWAAVGLGVLSLLLSVGLVSVLGQLGALKENVSELDRELADVRASAKAAEKQAETSEAAREQQEAELLRALVATARGARERGDLAGAEAELDRAAALRERAPAVLVGRGELAMARLSYRKAAALAEQALEVGGEPSASDPVGLEALELRGRARAALNGADEQAGQDFARLVELRPDEAEPLLLLAQSCFRRQDKRKALQLLERIRGMEGVPKDVRVEAFLLQSQVFWDDPKQRAFAVTSAGEAAKLDFPNAKTHAFHGMAYFRQGNAEKAGFVFRAAKRINEDDPWLRFLYGVILTESKKPGDLEQAKVHLQRAVELGLVDVEVRFRLSQAQVRLGAYREARDNLDALLEVDPKHALAYGIRAAARNALDDPKGAREDLIKALEIETRPEIRAELERNLRQTEAKLQ